MGAFLSTFGFNIEYNESNVNQTNSFLTDVQKGLHGIKNKYAK